MDRPRSPRVEAASHHRRLTSGGALVETGRDVRLDHNESRAILTERLPEMRADGCCQPTDAALHENVRRALVSQLLERLGYHDRVALHHVLRNLRVAGIRSVGHDCTTQLRSVGIRELDRIVIRAGSPHSLGAMRRDCGLTAFPHGVVQIDDALASEQLRAPGH